MSPIFFTMGIFRRADHESEIDKCRKLRPSLFPFRRKVMILFMLSIEFSSDTRKCFLYSLLALLPRYKGQLAQLPNTFHQIPNPDLFIWFYFFFYNKGLITQVWGTTNPAYLIPIPLTPTNCTKLVSDWSPGTIYYSKNTSKK